MNKIKASSWKTTSTGITLIVGAVVGVYFAIKDNQLSEATITSCLGSLLAGIGLLSAKDHNVSGNPPKTIDPK